MKKLGILAAVLAVLVLVGPASAQDKKGKGRGFRSGFGLLGLLTNKDVHKDLQLSGDQVAQFKKLADKQKEALEGLNFKDFEKMKELHEETKKAVDEILKDNQAKRFRQLQLQQAGAMAFFNPKVAETLGLSDEQKEKIKEVLMESGKKRFAIFKEFKGDREGAMKKMAEMNKETLSAVLKTLTDEQKTKFKEMQGPPFKGTLPPGGFFPGGFGPRRGARGASQIETINRRSSFLG